LIIVLYVAVRMVWLGGMEIYHAQAEAMRDNRPVATTALVLSA
jgi:hypothetical protein